MEKIETNLDIIFEKNKKKIVVNIYSDIKNNEAIYHKNDIYNRNNNDTLNFISNVLSVLEQVIFNFYKYIIYSFPSILIQLYRIQYILIITTLLFSVTYSIENNSHLSTNLMISAYFPKTSNIVFFKSDDLENVQDKIQEKKEKKNSKKVKQINDKNFNEKINNMNENIKNYIHTSANTKSTYINYEQKECVEIVNNNNSSKGEIYIFFIIPIKSLTFSIISISTLILFIKIEFLSKLSHLFLFNLACIFAVDNAIKFLYDNTYFIASSFMLLLLLYLFKNLIDSFYLLLKYRKDDFEIFSNDLIAKNQRQFVLKFVILNLLVILSGFFSFVLYKLVLNYIIFYLCLLTLISFLCNCLEDFSPQELKPLKNILMFCCGLINLTISKLIHSSFLYNFVFHINSDEEVSEKDENDLGNFSFFFVSDLFSFFLFDYLNEFLEPFRNNFQFHKFLNKLDYIMIFFFIYTICLCSFSIVEQDINCFLLTIFSCKLMMHYFSSIFKLKYIRLLGKVVFILFIFTHLYFSTNIEEVFSKFVPFNKLKMKFFENIFDLLIIIMVTFYEFNIHYYLYFSEKSINNDEIKELPESQVNKILEFTSDKSIKNLKIQIIHDSFNKFKTTNALIITCDILMNYFNISMMAYIYQKYDVNVFTDILYISLIWLFLSTKYFILNDIKNSKEYSYIFFISFYFSLRLITIPFSTSKLLYIIFEISALFLISNYSINSHRNKFMDSIIIIYLICNYVNINRFFVALDIIALFISPKIKEYLVYLKKKLLTRNHHSLEENEFKNKLTFISFITILIILLIQIYIFQNLEKVIALLENISFKMEFNDKHNYYYEKTFVYYIINKINYLFEIYILD